MLKYIYISITSLLLFSEVQAQKRDAISPILNYRGGLVRNFSGGDALATRWMGLANVGFVFDTESARWWKGGVFDLEFISTHGKPISETTFHDLQVFYNLEAGNNPLLFWAMWYAQQFGKFRVRAGLQNINDTFMAHPKLMNFSGSSYGCYPTITLNYRVPNYPVAGLGVTFFYDVTPTVLLTTALYNGEVSDIKNDRFNARWPLNFHRDGLFSITELKYTSGREKTYLSSFGGGYSFHSGKFPSIYNPDYRYTNNHTMYAFGEQEVMKRNGKSLLFFLNGSYSLESRSPAYAYCAAGMVVDGLLTRSHSDQIGLGLTRLYYHEFERGRILEDALELYWRLDVNRYIAIKPTLFSILSTGKTTITGALLEVQAVIF